MTLLTFTLIILLGAWLAGLLGSLTGLGGGVVIIPLLTIGFGIDIRYAIGTSLVAVIATSSGAAAAYVKEGFTNIRIGMFLEVATTSGAVLGAVLATYLPTQFIAILAGIVILYSALISLKKKQDHLDMDQSSKLARWLKLNGTYPDQKGNKITYAVHHVAGGYGMMMFAGMISGLLGLGSGSLKVVAMDNIMHIPFKVSTTTSNFMIGVTAAASATVYLSRGYIDPILSMPVVVGVLLGSMIGARILMKSSTSWLRILFIVVIAILGIEMIYNGILHKI
ncbi:MAG: sulfite exporter TauE/SafE family protein [Thermoflavifilum sp.]|nr:sulfite exporter TauE/SafE family protein [Thermoflavifilum sp.]